MEAFALSALPRTKGAKARLSDLRRGGQVPAIVYGGAQGSELISVPAREVKTFFAASHPNRLVALQMSQGKTQMVLVYQVDRDPVHSDVVRHLDFLRIEPEKPVTVDIPIRHEGTPVGVKNEGGQFSVMKRFVRIRCLPDQIPEAFHRDVSGLHSGTIVYTRDLEIAFGKVITPGKTALYGVTAGRKEEAPATGPEKEAVAGAKSEKEAAEGASKAEPDSGNS